MKDTAIHKQIVGKSTLLPILSTAMACDGVMISTNLDQCIRTQTDLPNGLYQLVGGSWVSSPLPVDEFPKPEEVGGYKMEMTLDRVAAKRLLACMSVDETRYVLCGVLFEVMEDGIILTSTDGRRLTTCKWATARKPAKSTYGQYIVPHLGKANTHPLTMLMKDKKRNDLTLHVGKEYMHLSNGEQTITAKLTDGTYPNYRQIIPADTPGMFYVDQDVMSKALKKAGEYTKTDERFACVKLSLMDDCVRLHANDVDRAIEIDIDVPAKHESRVENVSEFALCVDFLIDTFIQEPGVVYFAYHDGLSPVCAGTKLKDGKLDKEDVTVQMPMRIS